MIEDNARLIVEAGIPADNPKNRAASFSDNANGRLADHTKPENIGESD